MTVGIRDFLGADQLSTAEWRFALGPHLHGAYGGAFGGVIAASALLVARALAEGRTPAALHCFFLRSLPGGATGRGTILHSGRSLSCVSVDIVDERGQLATQATVSLVDPSRLRAIDRPSAGPPQQWSSFEGGRPWPVVAPIVEALDVRTVASGEWGVANAIPVPWGEDGHGAEAACLAADAAVGPPLGTSMSGEGVGTPNPDLSVRFCGTVASAHVIGVGRLVRAEKGTAAVAVDVWADEELVAIAVSSALLLPLP